MDKPVSARRRAVLRTVGTAAAAGVLGVGATVPAAAAGWELVETETDSTLYDVNVTVGGQYAVGAGGVVLERTSSHWRKIVDGGPTGNGNNLYGAAVTDDGERLWFVGASGAIGEYDVTTDTLYDHSAPDDVTNNFNDVAVTGAARDADVYVAGDSGKIYYSFENGETGTWDQVTPGSGSAINAIDFHDTRKGHAVDGNKTVFTTSDGTTWEKIGIEDANHNFYGVDSDGSDDVEVVGGGGTVYEWDGAQWVCADTGDATLRDVEVTDQDGYTVGGGGAVYEQSGGEWSPMETPTGENLKAVVDADPVTAVGAGGTVIEL